MTTNEPPRSDLVSGIPENIAGPDPDRAKYVPGVQWNPETGHYESADADRV